MGTITERKKRNGKTSFTAQIRIKRGGVVVHSEAQTFDRRTAAVAWLRKRETALAEPGALTDAKQDDVTLGEAIDKYVGISRKEMGRTKEQCLGLIRKHPIAAMIGAEIKSSDITSFASDLLEGWQPEDAKQKQKARQPQTVGNYLSHLGTVFTISRPMWGIKLDTQAFRDAQLVLARMGMTSRSRERDRRPTLDELDKLLAYFERRQPRAMPMTKVMLFSLFSTRRQEETTVLRWDDYEPQHGRILVRDMKHPGQKIGNDVWVDLPAEAMAVIDSMPKTEELIFPFNSASISANFTRACQILGIEDLHFHDLRHEGVSRLFEMGRTIPQTASVSGHRSWTSLKRYSHLRTSGDKYVGWKWSPQTIYAAEIASLASQDSLAA